MDTCPLGDETNEECMFSESVKRWGEKVRW